MRTNLVLGFPWHIYFLGLDGFSRSKLKGLLQEYVTGELEGRVWKVLRSQFKSQETVEAVQVRTCTWVAGVQTERKR